MWPRHHEPLVILAPMDGYTSPPFRRFIKAVEPRVLLFSEFLPATTIARKPALAEKFFKIYPDEEPVVIQLYGKDAEHFKISAKLAEDRGAAGVDINMGCPAKKVVAHQHGSALMKNIDLACRIIAEIKAAVSIPVTVKTRLGWENADNLIPFSLRLQEEGLDAITIHGRTYQQKFEGVADWQPIYALKEALTIPVFGNGDIDSPERARAWLNNLDGVMVGRAAIADPWLLQRICDAFAETPTANTFKPFRDKLPYWKQFAAMSVEGGEEFRACCAFRKYLVRLVRDLGLSTEVRKQAVSVSTLQEIWDVLNLFASQEETAAVVT
ncbi:MAG: tRNA-dihydrouridine synthase family protein [Acidobacteriota bacterium]|nr:tRNA-dihydrouridine synthase family protein [Acidobacteriota bacterium]